MRWGISKAEPLIRTRTG